eukprot:989125_1
MLVVATGEGEVRVNDACGEDVNARHQIIGEDVSAQHHNIECKDNEMREFIQTNDLHDIQHHILNSKFSIKHLQSLNNSKNADAELDAICDSEWRLTPSQKYRFKFAVASLGSLKHKVRKKILLIGDSGVGKTCIRNVLNGDPWNMHGNTTSIGIEFIIRNHSPNDNVQIKLQIWDTAGQERFQSLGNAFYRGADACILVYDITDENSYKQIDDWKTKFISQ